MCIRNDRSGAAAQFKTLKYHMDFPERFGLLEDAKAFFRGFVAWYNHEHRHSGLAMLTPATVHAGEADAVLDARHRVMLTAYASTPERFINGELPKDVWINKPDLESAA